MEYNIEFFYTPSNPGSGGVVGERRCVGVYNDTSGKFVGITLIAAEQNHVNIDLSIRDFYYSECIEAMLSAVSKVKLKTKFNE